MQISDEMIREAVEVFMTGVSPEPWDTESATALVRQVLEAALSAAEREIPYHCDVCTVPGHGDAPCSPLCDRSAPSVAVKSLHQAATDFMHLFIQDGHLTVQDLEDTDLIPAYEKLSAALSAQVQDVAGSQSQVTHEDICNTRDGGPCNCDWSAADEYQAHPDDIAVDRFAEVMKAKLAKKRDEGRGGWEDKDECSQIFLSQLLREHVEKGDPVDVGNLAMMLHQRGERIASLLEALQGE